MAPGFDSFSIRDYTAKMRAVDATTSWPFGSSEGHRPSRLLPPITCRKFRWWSADLKATSSNTSESDAAEIYTEARTSTDDGIDTHEDGEEQEKQTPRAPTWIMQQQHTKVRTPKKRSIAELFAAAPQVHHDDSDDEGYTKHPQEDEDEEEKTAVGPQGSAGVDDDSDVPTPATPHLQTVQSPRKRKLEFVDILMSKKANKRRTRMMMTKYSSTSATTTAQTSSANKNRRGRRKKRMLKNTKTKTKVGATRKQKNKDAMHNVRLPSKVDYALLLHGSQFRRCGKKTKKLVDKRKKDTGCIPKKMKKNSVQTASMETKKQLRKCASLPVRSILKKHTRVASTERNKKNGDTLNFDSGQNDARQSRKHVHFSDGNGITSFSNEQENTDLQVELPQAVNIDKMSSGILPSSSSPNESRKDEIGDKDEAGRANDSITDVSQVSSPRDNLVHIHISTEVSRAIDLNLQSSETTKFGQPLDLNTTSQDFHGPNLSTICFSSATTSDFQSGRSSLSLKEKPDEQLLWNKIPIRDKSRVPASVNPDNITVCDSPFTGSISQSSVSCLVRQINNYQSSGSDNVVNNAFNQTFKSPSLSAQHQKDLKDNSHLSNDISQINSAALCQEKFKIRETVGLPLNSQGEFIRCNYRTNVISEQLLQNHNKGSCSNDGFTMWDTTEPRYASESLRMKDRLLGYKGSQIKSTCPFPYKTIPGGNQYDITTGPYASKFPVRGHKDHCQRLMQGHDGSMQYLEKNHLAANIHSKGERELPFPHSYDKIQMCQIGRSKTGSIIQPTMRLMGKDVTVAFSSEDHEGLESCNAWREKLSLDRNQPVTSLSNPCTSSWFSQEDNVNCQSSEAARQQYLSDTQYKTSNLYRTVSGVPRKESANSDNNPCEICRNAISLDSEFLKGHNQGFAVPNSIQLAATTSSKWMDNPYAMMSQKPSAEAYIYKSVQSIPRNPVKCQLDQMHSFWGTSAPSLQRQYHENKIQTKVTQAPMCNFPHWLRNDTHNKGIHSSIPDLVSNHCPCTVSDTHVLSSSTPLCHSLFSFPVNDIASSGVEISSPLIPSSQGISASTLAMKFNSSVNKTKLKETQKSFDSLKPGYHYLVRSAHISKIKKGCYQMSHDFQRPAKKPNLTMECHSEVQEGTRTMHQWCSRDLLHGNTEKTADTVINLNGTESVNAHSCNDSRIGPVRLIPGAKHILRPCQNNDQDRTTPVHSTVPFAVGTNYRNISEPHGKSAQIYQF